MITLKLPKEHVRRLVCALGLFFDHHRDGDAEWKELEDLMGSIRKQTEGKLFD